MGRRTVKYCLLCDKRLPSKPKNRSYCTVNHKQKAYNIRKRAESLYNIYYVKQNLEKKEEFPSPPTGLSLKEMVDWMEKNKNKR